MTGHHEPSAPAEASIRWIDLAAKTVDITAEVLAGLREEPKRVAAKFFYDERGSALFEEITTLPEYYLTRTELALLAERAKEMVEHFGPSHALIEFGSGSSTKVRMLLDAAGTETAAYMPIDLSGDFLRDAAMRIAADYPALEVIAVCGDYTRLERLPSSSARGKQIVYFPGSTLGNLEPDEATLFFRQTAGILRRGDGMLIGVDLKKDRATLDAAYNDSRGVTAAFNRNVLVRLQHDAGARFDDVDAFEHVAFYNEEAGRIEMHLRSRVAQTVRVAGETFSLQAGEMIHTENSYKYDDQSFDALLEGSAFRRRRSWSDSGAKFAVHYLEVE